MNRQIFKKSDYFKVCYKVLTVPFSIINDIGTIPQTLFVSKIFFIYYAFIVHYNNPGPLNMKQFKYLNTWILLWLLHSKVVWL